MAFLLKDQNVDGSWGSPERTKDLNIIAGIGSHHAFRTAVTALCVSALIEVSEPRNTLVDPAAVRRAIERGEEFLFRELPLVRRDDPMLIYNVWAHAYGIQALVRMHGRLPHDTARRTRIEELIRGQYDRLTRYEVGRGGLGLLRLRCRHPAAQQRLVQLRQRHRPRRLSRGQADRRLAAGKTGPARRRGDHPAAQPRLQLSLRPLSPLHRR